MRPGFKIYFPADEYVLALRYLAARPVARYREICKAMQCSQNVVGVKVRRMEEAGIIKSDSKRGSYSITPFGSKVLRAYDAYMEIMKDVTPTEGSNSSQPSSRSTAKRKKSSVVSD